MADQSITDYTAATALARADLVEVVQDVATTPVNKKATLDVLDPGNTLGGDSGGDATNVAVGPTAAWVAGTDHVIIGNGAQVSQDDVGNANIAIGSGATCDRDYSVAVGYQAACNGSGDEVAIGRGASTQTGSVAVGHEARSFGTNAVAIGDDSDSTGSAVAVGYLSQAVGSSCVAIGIQSRADATSAVAIGDGSDAGHTGSVAIGLNATTTAADQVMVGPRDIEITGTVKGLVLEDRTLATRHRVYLDNGTLSIEAA